MLSLHAADRQDAALFTVAAFTGLRLGELRALQWGDLDFGTRLVHVRRSFTRDRKPLPKSRRVRSVPMIDPVIAALDRLSRGALFTDDDDFVFVNDTGGMVEEPRSDADSQGARASRAQADALSRPAALLLLAGRAGLPRSTRYRGTPATPTSA